MVSIKNRLSFLLVFSLPCGFNLFGIKSAEEILGYNPHLSDIPLAVEGSKNPVVGVLGFPDLPTMYQGKGVRGQFDTPTTFTVIFSFKNNLLMTAAALNPFFLASCIKSIDLGQEGEAFSLLYVLVQCYRAGYPVIHIFANSRGGAATLMALYMISHYDEFSSHWNALECTTTDVRKLRDCLANGKIFLAHPLLNHEAALQQAASFHVYPFLRVPGFHAIKTGIYWTLRAFLYVCTSFDYQRAQALSPYECLVSSINSLCWPYAITIATAYNETIVGTAHFDELYELAKKYPTKLTWRQGGYDHWDIKNLLADFRALLDQPRAV